MMWIEVLSRHGEVASRIRLAANEAHVGRGYDNDVIVDDPYVAPRHLRIFLDDAGRLTADDLGSLNGTFRDGSNERLGRIAVDGDHPIRIGRTLLRVRRDDHAVAPDRVAAPGGRRVTGILVATLGIAVLVLTALGIWIVQTSESRPSDYPLLLIWTSIVVIAWAGLWALLSRVFSGRSRFMRNLLIALGGALALIVYDAIARVLAFSFVAPLAATYEYATTWTVLAAICFLHLREIGRARLWLKGAIVVAVLVILVAAQTLQNSEDFSMAGARDTTQWLLPPSFRAVPVREEAAFFGAVGHLRDKIDAHRRGTRPAEAAGR